MQYQNASEVVRAGLRLLKAEEGRARRQARRPQTRPIQEGLDDMAAGRFAVVDDLDDYFRKLEAEVDAELDAEAAPRALSPNERGVDRGARAFATSALCSRSRAKASA